MSSTTEKETYTATFRLMRSNGVQGPRRTVEVDGVQHAKELAFAWSEGQIGHPWDVCTVEIHELDYVAEITE